MIRRMARSMMAVGAVIASSVALAGQSGTPGVAAENVSGTDSIKAFIASRMANRLSAGRLADEGRVAK